MGTSTGPVNRIIQRGITQQLSEGTWFIGTDNWRMLLYANKDAVLVFPEGQVSISELLLVKESAELYRGKRVVLAGAAPALFRWLLVLDGVAASVVILPKTFIDYDSVMVLGDCFLTDSVVARSGWLLDSQLSGPIPAPRSLSNLDAEKTPLPIDTQWLIATSGTTGKPRFTAHSGERLFVHFRGQRADGRMRWGLMFDEGRFAGIQVFLQAMIGGQALLLPIRNWQVSRKIAWLAQQSCNALSATPSLWRQILACPASHQLPLVQITLGGEICDAAILGALRIRFPTARITQIYASTEAGVVFSVHDGQPGFPAAWLKAGVKDCKLRIAEDETLEVARKSANGEQNWLNTGDIVELVGERVFFKGRKSGLINVGGQKVYPEEVETVVALVEGVESVLVSARNSSMMGNLLEAQIVPTASAPPDLAERIRLHCKQVLPRFKQPAFIKIVSELATNSNGKRVRREST
jgi:acyl-CoA synthetase (AMP-forming)/AMP-acid ligase II